MSKKSRVLLIAYAKPTKIADFTRARLKIYNNCTCKKRAAPLGIAYATCTLGSICNIFSDITHAKSAKRL